MKYATELKLLQRIFHHSVKTVKNNTKVMELIYLYYQMVVVNLYLHAPYDLKTEEYRVC